MEKEGNQPADRRIRIVSGHLTAIPCAGKAPAGSGVSPPEEAQELAGRARLRAVKPLGWGHSDTEFRLERASREVELTGTRYIFSGQRLPKFVDFVERFGVRVDRETPANREPCKLDAARPHEGLLDALVKELPHVSFGQDDQDRLFHAHGHSMQEVWNLRYAEHWGRAPDLVVYATSHDDVEAVVRIVSEHGACIIPFGGGTSVTQSVLCPDEDRVIVSLDMSLLNRIKWVDPANLMICAEAGCVGVHLEKMLSERNLTLGHEPDSWEFSTVGGWVATRASGMKKNQYGNIEDLVVDARVVTPKGVLQESTRAPRVSAGPSAQEVILGSEGTLGVITEVILKVRPAPAKKAYGSIVFPSFEQGLHFMWEVGKLGWQPASIRLMDNLQFQFGQAIKPESKGTKKMISEAMKFFLLKVKHFDPDDLSVCTMTFEGSQSEVLVQQTRLYHLARSKFGGVFAGPENGKTGYFLTFMIAYLRDFALDHGFIAESFETSCPWTEASGLCRAVIRKIRSDCKAIGVRSDPFVTCRITQVYNSGCCIYFYFGFAWEGLKDPMSSYSRLEEEARRVILEHGGTISHHHGVGKLRKHWLSETTTVAAAAIRKGVKDVLDPKNIFASGNLDF